MLELLILDKSAESRNKIRNKLCNFIYKGAQGVDVVPRINIKPISLEEVKFQNAPKLIVLGNEFLLNEKSVIGDVKKLFPNALIIAWLTEELNKLFIIEELARLGITDIWPNTILAEEFFRKLIMLSRKSKKNQNSKIILVDSGKGGSGVTSIVSALGEIYLDKEKKVLLIDCDVESQDLSRFLQVRPFINENLGVLLDGLKPISQDALTECYQKVWDDEENLYCMSPTVESENLYSAKSSYYKNFLSILECLDACFDYIIIDMACLKGMLKTSLYKACDMLVVVINNDPASIFSNLELLKYSKNFLSSEAKILIVENKHEKFLLDSQLLKDEILSSSFLLDDSYFSFAFKNSIQASRWPGSGATLYSQATKDLKEKLFLLSEKIDGKEKEYENAISVSLLDEIINKIKIIFKIVLKRIDKILGISENEQSEKLIDNQKVIALSSGGEKENKVSLNVKNSVNLHDENHNDETKKFFTKAV